MDTRQTTQLKAAAAEEKCLKGGETFENGVGGQNIVCEVCYMDWRCDGNEHDIKRN
jgi:hypothetical protein